MRALVTEDIMEGCVDANMGGGGPVGPKAWQDCNVNDLTHLQNYDPISGFPVYKALLCEVEKIRSDTSRVVQDSGEMSVTETLSGNGQEEDRIYLDHNATTPLDPEIREYFIKMIEAFGNPSGLYAEGREARKRVETARKQVANLINTTARRIVFTSGGSESNNFALKGILYRDKDKKGHVIASCIEHPSVLRTCEWLERQGFPVTYLDVDEKGRVDPADLGKAIRPDTVLVSLMLANNEIGTIQTVKELAAIAHRHGIVFHTDAVQAIGKVPVDVEDLGVDLLSISGHKLHAPKGVGALYIRQGIELEPLVSGGGQEGKIRGGTENVPGILTLGKSCEVALRQFRRMKEVATLRDRLQEGLMELFSGARVNGDMENRLPNTLSIILPEVRGESLVLSLDKHGVSLSSGSACRSGSPEPSHVLMAIGCNEEEAHCSVRFSLGRGTTQEEIDRTLKAMASIKIEMKEKIRFVSCR